MASQINTEICRIVELANDRISRHGCASCPVSHPRLKQGQEVRSAPSVNGPYDFPWDHMPFGIVPSRGRGYGEYSFSPYPAGEPHN